MATRKRIGLGLGDEGKRPEVGASGLFFDHRIATEAKNNVADYYIHCSGRLQGWNSWLNGFSSRSGANIAGRCFMFAGGVGEGRCIVGPIAGTYPSDNPTERLRGDIGGRTGAGKPTVKPNGGAG